MPDHACPACRYDNPPGAQFCERCGEPFAAAASGEATASGESGASGESAVAAEVGAAEPGGSAPFWRSSTSVGTPCGGCGAEDGFTDNYCDHCGRRRIANRDRVTVDLGAVGGATDRGRRKAHNQDAFAVGRVGELIATVVCDGVSSSTHPDIAALAATEAGIEVLLRAIADGEPPEEASRQAGYAAAEAAAKVGDPAHPAPPSCTYVSAVVSADRVTVGWIGDSRAYWDGPDGVRALTVDDTLAGRLAAEGVPEDDERYADPQAVALQRWLGADAVRTEPRIKEFIPEGSGTVVVCSDGLSRYLTTPGELATLAPDGSPADRAAALVRHAVGAGGVDNIAVAVLPYPPSEESAAQPPDTAEETGTAPASDEEGSSR